MNAVVLDTNVLVVANERENPKERSQACVEACQDALMEIRNPDSPVPVLLDSQGLIWEEYSRYCTYKGQPGLGDAFFLWLFERQGDLRYCKKIDLRNHPERTFEQFPADEALEGFDRSDRKFVAVALGYEEKALIYNAVDSDWWQYRQALAQHGVAIDFLCEEELRASART